MHSLSEAGKQLQHVGRTDANPITLIENAPQGLQSLRPILAGISDIVKALSIAYRISKNGDIETTITALLIYTPFNTFTNDGSSPVAHCRLTDRLPSTSTHVRRVIANEPSSINCTQNHNLINLQNF